VDGRGTTTNNAPRTCSATDNVFVTVTPSIFIDAGITEDADIMVYVINGPLKS